ncbi:MAG: MerR family transcriptional regulator [Rhodocyclaceae bacterium]|nr:MerR family transcriptional regulator [Rhodocyclaceae bacterium]
MRDDEILTGDLLEDCWLTIEQVAAACEAEPKWLLDHLEAGLLPQAESVAGVWRLSAAGLLRARRMRRIERDFDAVPELAALVADLLEELDRLRAQLPRPLP